MVYGIWYMVYGIWYMVYGIWYMVYGIWYMVYGTLTICEMSYALAEDINSHASIAKHASIARN